MQPLENLTQCAANQTLAEIKHGADSRLGLLQHNLISCAEVNQLRRYVFGPWPVREAIYHEERRLWS